MVEHLLAGGGQGGQGAAVEAVHQADDLIAALAVGVAAVLAGRLHGAFVGLGTGVGKEHLVKAGALAQGLAGVGVVQVGGMLQLARLLAHGGHPVRVAVAQAVHADAAGEIQIFLAVKIGDMQPAALLQGDLVAAIGVGHMGIVPFNDLLIGHGVSLPGGVPP